MEVCGTSIYRKQQSCIQGYFWNTENAKAQQVSGITWGGSDNCLGLPVKEKECKACRAAIPSIHHQLVFWPKRQQM